MPRLRILEIFENSDVRHLSAEDVYKVLLQEGMDIGLATIYRVLTQFEQAGLLIRHHFESGKAVFELKEGGHHDHIVCLECGHVEEFYDPEIEKRQTEVAQDAASRSTSIRCISMRSAPRRLSAPEPQACETAERVKGAALRRDRVVTRHLIRSFTAPKHLGCMLARRLGDLHAAEHARDLVDALLRVERNDLLATFAFVVVFATCHW